MDLSDVTVSAEGAKESEEFIFPDGVSRRDDIEEIFKIHPFPHQQEEDITLEFFPFSDAEHGRLPFLLKEHWGYFTL